MTSQRIGTIAGLHPVLSGKYLAPLRCPDPQDSRKMMDGSIEIPRVKRLDDFLRDSKEETPEKFLEDFQEVPRNPKATLSRDPQ